MQTHLPVAKRLVAAMLAVMMAASAASAAPAAPIAAAAEAPLLRPDGTLSMSLATVPAVMVPAATMPSSGISLAQGAAVIGATAWHEAGYTGRGVRIGIIDGGFRGISSLPAGIFGGGIEARCYSAIGTFRTSLARCDETPSEHGTAVAETAAAVAPGARILIANPISFLDMKATIAWMTSRGARIVNASFNSGDVFEGPGDGTSPFADAYYKAIDYAVSLGALWVSAAGNSGDSGWNGPFVDADADDWLDVGPANASDPTLLDETNSFVMRAGSSVRIGLRWPDSWGRATDDLDLYLCPEGSDEPVASSTSRQTGSGNPVERLSFRSIAGGTYEIAVRHRSGDVPPTVEVLMASQGMVDGLEHQVATGSLPAPADTANPGAIVVGAVDVRTPDLLENYSSRGPTTDGRTRPDVVAPDCADTSIGAFCGTSQATPYAAGAAALLLQADPSLGPEELAATLRSRAIPLAGGNAPDPTYGQGRISLGLPPAVPPASTTTTPTGVRAISSTGAGVAWRGLSTSAGGHVHTVTTDTSGALGPVSLVVYRSSTDGGATFAAPIRLSSGSLDATGQPVPAAHAAVASAGSLIAAAWLEGSVGSGATTAVLVAMSPDGGMTWGPPLAVSPTAGRAGRPAIATDGLRVAVAWTQRDTGRIVAIVSPDGGATWPTQVVPATTSLVPFGAALGRDGIPALAISGSAAGSTLHLAWSSSGSRLVYRRSTDLGLSWSAAATLDSLAVGGSRPWLAVAGSSVAVGYAARQRSGAKMLAYVRRSTNGGATWSTRSLVAATTTLASSYPVLTVTGAGGATIRVAYAGCTTSACTRSRLWYRQSTNGGRTWSTAVALTSSTQNARPAGLAATTRVLVLYALNASTTTARATLYLRVR